MTAPTTAPAPPPYLDAVARELADLPVEERADLLEDLSLHLAALAAEDDDRPVEVRLGPPAAYAAELRAAAGLPPRPAAVRLPRADGLARLWRSAAGSRAGREVRAFLPELRPAWWVLRGYLAVLLPALWSGGVREDVPVPQVLGSRLLGLVVVGAAVVLSVRLGRARLPGLRGAVAVAGSALLAAWGLVTLLDLPSRAVSYVYVDGGGPVYEGPLQTTAGPVTDVYPYAADGTPLDGVLLYDQDGRPLRPALQEWFADGCRRVLAQPRAADGVPVPHSFPQQYVLDPSGTTLDGLPAAPGQCVEDRPRPQVALPVFPPPAGREQAPAPAAPAPTDESAAPAPSDPAQAPAPAPQEAP